MPHRHPRARQQQQQQSQCELPALRCDSALSWLTVQRVGGTQFAREIDLPLDLEAQKLQRPQDQMAWATMTTGQGEKVVAFRVWMRFMHYENRKERRGLDNRGTFMLAIFYFSVKARSRKLTSSLEQGRPVFHTTLASLAERCYVHRTSWSSPP